MNDFRVDDSSKSGSMSHTITAGQLSSQHLLNYCSLKWDERHPSLISPTLSIIGRNICRHKISCLLEAILSGI